MNKQEFNIFGSGFCLGIIVCVFLLILLMTYGCDDGKALPKYSGQTKQAVITINPNTARVIMAPKDSKKQAKFYPTDSIYVSPSEAFIVALKGGKPICTVFTRQDSAIFQGR